MWNRHRESENAKLVQVRNFITFELKVIRHEERKTQSFYADCFYIVSSQPNQRAAPVAHKVVWPRRAPKVNLLLPRQELNSLLFLKSQNPQPTLPGMTSLTFPVLFPIWEFYFDICEWRILSACAWTPALMLHLTNPCIKRKVLILTKPKGKIYKTKSLRHYITAEDIISPKIKVIAWLEFELAHYCPSAVC